MFPLWYLSGFYLYSSHCRICVVTPKSCVLYYCSPLQKAHPIQVQNSFLKILFSTWSLLDFNSNLFLPPTASIIIPKWSYQSPGQNSITCFKSWLPNGTHCWKIWFFLIYTSSKSLLSFLKNQMAQLWW